MLASVMCLFFAVMTWIFDYNVGIGCYTFFIGLLMTIWEFDFLYRCIGPCVKVYQFTQETLFFKKPIVLTVLYSLMSILTFIRETPSIGGGIFLLIAAIINIFAQVNQTTDASDSSKTKNKNNPNGADLISNEA